MHLRRWLAGGLFAAMFFACIPARAPDYGKELRRFIVYCDDTLPREWIQKGTYDWSRVTGDVFYLVSIHHQDALELRASNLNPDSLVMVDATNIPDPCTHVYDVGCYLNNVIYFLPKRIEGDGYHIIDGPESRDGTVPQWGSWDRVPAHEIGHFLGLDHVEKGASIMRKSTGESTTEPTVEDGEAVIRIRLRARG